MSTDDYQNDLSDLSMLELFRMEVETQSAILNQGLLEMEHIKPSPELLENMMRAAHSVKGAARMVNIEPVVQIAHLMEDCFVAVQAGTLTLNEKDIDNLLAGTDLMLQIAQENDKKIEHWLENNSGEFQYIENALRSINDDNNTPESADENLREPDISANEALEADYDPVQIVSESSLSSQSTVRISIDRLDKFLSLAGKSLVETHQFSTLMPAFWQLKHKQQLIISDISRLQESLSEEVDTEQLKDMVKNILQEMNALRHQFADKVAALDAIDRRTSTISDHLHREIMSSRMRPISEIIGALPRMVRDLGRRLNKEVRLRMSGISTLVDRHVLEKIDTPVKHLIQNAIDHGVEYPEEREQAGKPVVASITLSASMNAGMLYIDIEDDGRGLDPNLLRHKIIEKGLATEKELENRSSREIMDYLFYPGFSTRDQVNEVSGRGVGLDLVKEAVSGLNGTINASSTPGKGMKFQMVLPLTVSVLRVMLVNIRGESYALPMTSIERIVYVAKEEMHKQGNHFCLSIDDESVPLIHANMVFDYSLPAQLPPQLPVVIVESSISRFGIVVEKIDGEQEVSLQKLSEELGKIRGINSAAILNNGALSLIIEVEEFVTILEELMHGNDDLLLYQIERAVDNKPVEPGKVLIVDDSLTVREMERKIITKMGLEVLIAVDGLNALEILSKENICMMITDIDMPKMNGIQLINEIRYRATFEKLPVLIVSNRDKSFIEQSVILNEITVFYPKDQFSPSQFAGKVAELYKPTQFVS